MEIVGCAIKCTTSLGETVEGTIFTYDANTNCVVLGASPSRWPSAPSDSSVPLALYVPLLQSGTAHTVVSPPPPPPPPLPLRAEQYIPMTQKKNIRIMKAGLLKDVQVISTPQSRGEQAPVRNQIAIPVLRALRSCRSRALSLLCSARFRRRRRNCRLWRWTR